MRQKLTCSAALSSLPPSLATRSILLSTSSMTTNNPNSSASALTTKVRNYLFFGTASKISLSFRLLLLRNRKRKVHRYRPQAHQGSIPLLFHLVWFSLMRIDCHMQHLRSYRVQPLHLIHWLQRSLLEDLQYCHPQAQVNWHSGCFRGHGGLLPDVIEWIRA